MIAAANGRATQEYAADYLAAGLSVVPIRGDKSKAPALAGWKQYQTTPATLSDVRRLWLADNIGVGIIHGRVSGNTEAIDIDNGDLFRPFLVEVERLAPGLLDRLTFIKTPRPGHHIVYKCEAIEGSQKLAQYPNPDDPAKPKTLIETKGEGGYTVAPGSPGCCHETGGVYEHVDGPPLTELTTITPEEREILFRVARSFNQWHEETPTTACKPQGERYEGLSPGDDYNRRATWEEILEPHGWTHSHEKYWRRPGKENGWSATVGCKSAGGTDLFCCFSDNAHPLTGATGGKSCTAYSKFALYTALNHGGDYSAAARRLRTEGYGDQPRERVHDGGDGWTNEPPAKEKAKPKRRPIEKFTLAELRAAYPTLAEPVIGGIGRLGETLNIVSDSKVGKSWLLYTLLLCIVSGRDWLDKFPTKRGRVLLIDNELPRSVIAYRLNEVATAMGMFPDEYEGLIEIWPLRGNLRSIEELVPEFDDVEPGKFVFVGCDARYRFPTGGQGENDNQAVTEFFNTVDQLADRTQALWGLVHHSTKGSQSDKKVTDVGAGAGAQSRAADAHLVLRPHEDDAVFVLDGVVRSFAPIEPVSLRWGFPLWTLDEWADPSKLAGKQTRSEERTVERDREGTGQIISVLVAGPATASVIRQQTGISKDRCDRLLNKLTAEKQIDFQLIKLRGNECRQYHVVDEQPTT